MKQGQIGMTLDVAGYETAMEGEDMRAVVLTLDPGQTVPWHYHSTITDSFVCLKGPMVVETRAPRNTYVLNPGERCAVPPKTAHPIVARPATVKSRGSRPLRTSKALSLDDR